MKVKMIYCKALFLVMLFQSCSSEKKEIIIDHKTYTIESIAYKQPFTDHTLEEDWIFEIVEDSLSQLTTNNNKVFINVSKGATLWLNKKLSGNILIEYERKVIVENGKNDRLSDLNQFWMAHDPNNPNLFTRNGTFEAYDDLKMYYAGIGGNYNTTTRFREYLGNSQKPLITDHSASKYMLEPNKVYLIQTLIYNGLTQVIVNGEKYFTYDDPTPLTSGYFGFRTTLSHHEISNFKIVQLQ